MMARLSNPATPWSIILVLAIGVSFGGIVDPVRHGLEAVWYWAFPVVETETTVLYQGGDYIDLSVSGVKRWPCRFDPPVGAEVTLPLGSKVDVLAVRIDRPEYGTTRPTGPFGPQIWRVGPLEGGVKVRIYINHVCDGRTVTSVFAEADIQKGKK